MLIADFSNGEQEVTVARVTQWDFGRKIIIKGIECPEGTEVHFAEKYAKFAKITYVDSEGAVEIPQYILMQSNETTAYIYTKTQAQGKTIKTIKIPISQRPKPEHFETPDQEQDFEKKLDYVRKLIPTRMSQLENDMPDECKMLEDYVKFQINNQWGMILYTLVRYEDEANCGTPTGIYRVCDDNIGFIPTIRFTDNVGNKIADFAKNKNIKTIELIRNQLDTLGRKYMSAIVTLSTGEVFNIRIINDEFTATQSTYSASQIDNLFTQKSLPDVSQDDEGKTLKVVNGKWSVS